MQTRPFEDGVLVEQDVVEETTSKCGVGRLGDIKKKE